MATGNAARLAAADPLPQVLAYLQAHPDLTDALGGPGRVSGLMEAPWPHLTVTPGPGGDMRRALWETVTSISLEAYGDPSGFPGIARVRQLVLLAVAATVEMPELAPPGPAVICHVKPSGALAYAPLETGQPRWTAGILVTSHPAT
jgi:hypothetical protein